MSDALEDAVNAMDEGRLSDAARVLERAAAAESATVEVVDTLGVCLGRLGDWERALEVHERALTLSPSNALVHYNTGVACRELGLDDRAVQHFRNATELDPADPDSWLSLGTCLLGAGELQGAEPALRKALSLSNEDEIRHKALFNLGILYDDLDDSAAAVDCYRSALVTSPSDGDVAYNLALVLEDSERTSEAIDVLRRAGASRDAPAEIFAELSRMLLESGEPAEAARASERALALDPAHAHALYYATLIAYRNGRSQQAILLAARLRSASAALFSELPPSPIC